MVAANLQTACKHPPAHAEVDAHQVTPQRLYPRSWQRTQHRFPAVNLLLSDGNRVPIAEGTRWRSLFAKRGNQHLGSREGQYERETSQGRV